MQALRIALLLIDILLTAAIAGFFYAYTSSVMIGFDVADPAVAIPAMQAINANVRNPVFAPSFFGPVGVGLALSLSYLAPPRGTAARLAVAGFLVYLVGGFALTLAVNVPMNEAFASLSVPADAAQAAEAWRSYSARWTAWNTARTVFSFGSLMLLVWALTLEARRAGGRAVNRAVPGPEIVA